MKKLKKKLYIRILILIILIFLVIITSFKTCKKIYFVTNTFLENNKGISNSKIARWNFTVKIKLGNEVIENEN